MQRKVSHWNKTNEVKSFGLFLLKWNFLEREKKGYKKKTYHRHKWWKQENDPWKGECVTFTTTIVWMKRMYNIHCVDIIIFKTSSEIFKRLSFTILMTIIIFQNSKIKIMLTAMCLCVCVCIFTLRSSKVTHNSLHRRRWQQRSRSRWW